MGIGFVVLLTLIIGFPSSECNKRALGQLVESSTVVVVATVVEVEETPGPPSGQFKSVQRVNYRVDEVLKGSRLDDKINVAHLLVIGSKTTVDDNGDARLSEKLFAKGNRLILFLTPDDGKGYIQRSSKKGYKQFLAGSENCVPRADKENLRLVDEALRTQNTAHSR